jgi:uncharacterized protein YpmS
MLIACLIAFAVLIASWLVLPSSETVYKTKSKASEVTTRDTITVS